MPLTLKNLKKFAESLPDVAVVRNYLFMCSDAGQDLIKQDIKNGLVDRVVVAACTPRTHGPIFKKKLLKMLVLMDIFLKWLM